MVVSRKPLHNNQYDNLTDTIINKGGSSPFRISEENHNIKITIRLSSKMLNMLDKYLKNSIKQKTRTSWIREAVEEKFEKDILHEKF